MRLIQGGRLSAGDRVWIDGVWPATVVCCDFATSLFAGDVSIRLVDGSIELITRGRVERDSAGAEGGSRATPEGFSPV